MSRVEVIHLDGYALRVADPQAFSALCEMCHGQLEHPGDHLGVLLRWRMVDPEGVPWDDVRDVFQSGTYRTPAGWARRDPRDQ